MVMIINLIFQVLYLCLIARVVLSWIPHDPHNEIVKWIYKISDPLVLPIRQILPPLNIGIDISPILAFFALGIIRKFIFWVMF